MVTAAVSPRANPTSWEASLRHTIWETSDGFRPAGSGTVVLVPVAWVEPPQPANPIRLATRANGRSHPNAVRRHRRGWKDASALGRTGGEPLMGNLDPGLDRTGAGPTAKPAAPESRPRPGGADRGSEGAIDPETIPEGRRASGLVAAWVSTVAKGRGPGRNVDHDLADGILRPVRSVGAGHMFPGPVNPVRSRSTMARPAAIAGRTKCSAPRGRWCTPTPASRPGGPARRCGARDRA